MKKRFYQLLVIMTGTLVFSTFCFAAEPDKTLKVGISEDIRDWDAHRGTGHYEPEVKDAVFERLVATKPGTWEIVPGLAKSWEFSKDNKEVTFHLQKGVKFQKGYGELTADDVKASLLKGFDPKWEVSSVFRSIDRVEVVDRYTVKVVLKFPDVSFMTYELAKGVGYIIPKSFIEKMSVGEARRNPVGSGPYELETWVPMDKFVLRRYKDYHGKAPYFDRIEYIVFANQETLELALEKGDIDMGLISYKAIPRFRNLKDMRLYLGPSAGYAWAGMNVTRKPFDDVRVRKAIRYAINVDEILLGAFEGAPKRARSMFPPELPGYWKDAPLYQPDLKKAKELLAAGGFPDGLTANIVVSPANRGDLVVPIQIEQLKKIGITLKSTSLTRPAQVAEMQAGNFDMYYIEYRGFARDPFEATRWFTCEQSHAKGWNMSKWCNKEFDELRQKARGNFDEKERTSLYIKMQEIMDEDIPAIWIHNGLTAIAYKNHIDLEGKVNPDGRVVVRELRVK